MGPVMGYQRGHLVTLWASLYHRKSGLDTSG